MFLKSLLFLVIKVRLLFNAVAAIKASGILMEYLRLNSIVISMTFFYTPKTVESFTNSFNIDKFLSVV